MNKRTTGMLVGGLGALILSAGLVAYAQDGPPPRGPEGGPGIVGFEMGPERHIVKGAPMSAQSSSETVSVLGDGTHIDRKTTGAVYRDSQGRTRREETLPAMSAADEAGQPKQVVMIHDSVAGVHYMLRPDQKTAEKMSFHGHERSSGDEAMGGGRHERDSKNVTSESLGTQTINGVSAAGTRITRTIPAGEIGNDRAIQIVTEKWYSSDLQMDVLVKRSDPRFGTTTYQLTNISRDEPSASLFQVPPDYTVTAGKPHHMAIEPRPE
ncbi:MAG: hypothetical protein WA755_00430 [Candidatus Acidiferrales bacterium]